MLVKRFLELVDMGYELRFFRHEVYGDSFVMRISDGVRHYQKIIPFSSMDESTADADYIMTYLLNEGVKELNLPSKEMTKHER